MEEVLLIDEIDLASNTPLGSNIDIDKWKPALADSQRLYLKPILGEELYIKIVELFRTDSLTGYYLELYDRYVKNYLVHKGAERYLPLGSFLVNNNGITKGQFNGEIGASRNDIMYLVQTERDVASGYEKQMVDYLNKNVDNIPEYKKNCNAGKINPLGFYTYKYDKNRGY